MKKTKTSRLLSVLLIALLVLCSCTNKASIKPQQEDLSKTATATAQGYGGEVSVTITIVDGTLTEVKAIGEKETDGIGSKAIESLPEAILKAGSADVEVVSGATYTSKAIISAAKQAIAEAKGEKAEVSEVKMKAGTYTGSGSGFSRVSPITCEVEVNEDSILNIKVNEDNYETPPILQSAIDLLIPRIIENQSVAIDSITGATVSSVGIKEAVTNALKEAIKAGGSDENLISNFEKSIKKSESKVITLDTDVVVVGLGGSGIAAAVSASEQGVEVIAIDKAGRYGGTSNLTNDFMAINPKKFQEEHNDGKDYQDEEAMMKAWLKFTTGKDGNQNAKPELVKMFFEQSGPTLDWLVYEHGFDMGTTPFKGFTPSDIYLTKFQYGGLGYTIKDRPLIKSYYDNMIDSLEKNGGKYMLETEGTELIYDEASNTVKGIKTRNIVDGTEYIINAKAVISATGGFAGNLEMEEKYLSNEFYPLKGAWKLHGSAQNDGKIIESSINLGAGTFNIGMPPMVHNAAAKELFNKYPVIFDENKNQKFDFTPKTYSINDIPTVMGISPNVLQVNAYGERFTNESAMFTWWNGGPTFYSIWSEKEINEVKEKGFEYVSYSSFVNQGGVPEKTPMPEIFDVLDTAMEYKAVLKADTLEELADKMGVPSNKLTSSVARYNEMCQKGVDEDFSKDAKYLKAISNEGPYYATVCASYIYSTCGGLDINENLSVLKSDGKTPINGLYAIGTDSMGVLFSEEREYVTYGGAAMGWAYTSGYYVGKTSAEYVKSK